MEASSVSAHPWNPLIGTMVVSLPRLGVQVGLGVFHGGESREGGGGLD